MAMKPDEILAEMVKVYGLNGGRAQAWIEGLQAHLSAQAKVLVTDEDVYKILKAAGRDEFYLDSVRKAMESFAARLSQGASEESDLHVIMERNAWRAAMIGLCVPTREVDVATPELASEHLRKRLSQGAQGGDADSAIGYRGDVCDHGRGMDETCQEYPCWRDYTHRAVHAAVPDGWALTPNEPTQDMLNAARDWSLRVNGIGVGHSQATGCYQAMLTAAPQPPEGAR